MDSMTLSEFKSLLQENRNKLFQIVLPQGEAVPISFHITEVGRVEKTFIDCGGKIHTRRTCQLQVWVGEDEDHRIQAGKMADILERSVAIVPDDTLPLELEYELEGHSSFVSQFPVAGFSITDDAIVLHLGIRHTECLAPELCGVPSTTKSLSLTVAGVNGCGCGPAGCC